MKPPDDSLCHFIFINTHIGIIQTKKNGFEIDLKGQKTPLSSPPPQNSPSRKPSSIKILD